jgi:hypothetical protein
MIGKTALGAMAIALSMAGASAANAADFGAADMNIEFGLGGTITATFGNSGITEGSFTDTYTFRIPGDGVGSGSIITTADFIGGINDTDLLSVFVNGIEMTGLVIGQNESGFINNIPIVADAFNTIVISGLSRGNGSYGATATFTPSIPEPSTWAFMIMGLGMVGALSRYGRRRVNVAFS